MEIPSQSIIVATERAKAVLIISAMFIAFGALYSPHLLGTGIAMIVLVACVRLYATLELYALSRCRAIIPTVFAIEGDTVEIDIVVENPTIIPIAMAEVSVMYSQYLRFVEGARSSLIVVPAKGSVKLVARFRSRVGRHTVGPLKLAVRDLFGFFRFDYTLDTVGMVRCVPRASDVVVRRLLVFTRTTGLTRSRRAGYGVELYGVREYRVGDDVRRLVWRYLASRRRLVVKEMELETMNRVVFVIDGTSRTLAGPYGHTPFEYCCRIVASIARYLSRRGDLMGVAIFSEDKVFGTHKLSRGYNRILEVFARYSPAQTQPGDGGEEARSTALERAFRYVVRLLPREKSMVFFLVSNPGHIYRQTLAEVAKKLVVLGHEVYVVLPLITTFEVRGLPSWAQAVYRVKTFNIVREHLDYARALRKMGVKTIVAGAQHLPQMVVSLLETQHRYT